ncbi:MAG: ABC transporter substrate-binding protein [Rhodothermales bacterium]
MVETGCGRPEPNPSATAFTDDLGRTVHVEQPVQRVLTLAPNLTEVVFAAGAGDKIPAVSTADDWPQAIDSLPRYRTFPMDFEAIAAFDPDVLLATDQINAPRDADTFTDLGIPTFFFSFENLADVARSIRDAGELLGTEARANAAADSLEAAFTTLQNRTSGVAEKPLVLLLNGDRTLYAFGQGSYTHDLIKLAGGTSATADLATPAPVLSEEFVLTAKPDVIIGAFGEGYGAADLLALHPTWDVVPAVRDGRVYSLHGDFFQRPGPRLVEGARRMALMLHPELFEQTSRAASASAL